MIQAYTGENGYNLCDDLRKVCAYHEGKCFECPVKQTVLCNGQPRKDWTNEDIMKAEMTTFTEARNIDLITPVRW